jgi:hypothetical protein
MADGWQGLFRCGREAEGDDGLGVSLLDSQAGAVAVFISHSSCNHAVDPLAKTHTQLREDTDGLLALSGRHRPGRLRARAGGKRGSPRSPGYVGNPQRPPDPGWAPAGSYLPADELYQSTSPRARDLRGEQEESLGVSAACDSLSQGPRHDAGEHLPKAWERLPGMQEMRTHQPRGAINPLRQFG